LDHALVWRLRYREPEGPGLWEAEIDAASGEVRAFFEDARHAGVRGGVYPVAPDVGCTNGGCELDGFPMPWAGWTESGLLPATANGYGQLTCEDPGATYEARLAGPYAVVEDECGPFLEQAECGEVLELGLKAGENCAVAPGASPGNTAAARSAYYHINRTNEVARFYNPGLAWLDVPVTIHSNWNQVCNASYGGNAVYLYRSGSSTVDCANTGEIDSIVIHEWGHGFDENDGGGWDNTSEAYADVVAMLATRRSCFGEGLRIDGSVCTGYGDTCLTCTGFREHDWAARQANTPATPAGFVQNYCPTGTGPCGRHVHCESYPIDEAVFDLATRDLPASGLDVDSAWQLVERLWYTTRVGSGGDIYTCALPLSDSCSASSWYQRMRSADDDDADLANGTPHAAALHAAFARHGIACGEPSDPENQSTSSCPTLARPVPTLDETGPGPRLDWDPVPDADGYVVFRGDLGCSRQLVPVTTLTADTTSWLDPVADPGLARSYRVEAFGANAVCRSPVSACETAGGGPRLQKNSHRVVELGAHANGNGALDPGETAQLPVTLFNGGTDDALTVTGTLRTVDPLQGRVVEPQASYADIAAGEQRESLEPHFELTLFETGATCGATVPLELAMTAGNAAVRTRRFALRLGEPQRDFASSGSVPIPRMTPSPVTLTVPIEEAQTIAELDVSVSISHPNPAELVVDLISPLGTVVRLHDHAAGSGGIYTRYDLDAQPDGPGAMADFEGESTAGDWTLSVQDTIFGGLAGTIQGFTLHVTVEGGFGCAAVSCADPVPAAAVQQLHADRFQDAGDGSEDLAFGWNPVAGAYGYHLLRSPAALFESVVDLVGRTTGDTAFTLEAGAEAGTTLEFFLVRAVNGCGQEGP
jgi:subtilisin-like proprotein convertase family protein